MHTKLNTFKVCQRNWRYDFNLCDCFCEECPPFHLLLQGSFCILNPQHESHNETRKNSHLAIVVVITQMVVKKEKKIVFATICIVL